MSEAARAAEATTRTTSVEFRGHTFKIPTDLPDWSLDLVESIEEGKDVGICRGALGPEQWTVIKSLNLVMRDVDELASKISDALGFGSSGESPPSGA